MDKQKIRINVKGWQDVDLFIDDTKIESLTRIQFDIRGGAIPTAKLEIEIHDLEFSGLTDSMDVIVKDGLVTPKE